MATIEVAPKILNDVILSFGVDDFAAACSSATLTPSASNVTWKGLKPSAVFTFPTSPTWTLDLEYAQDWADEDSLSRYLFDHQGETIAATLTPNSGDTAWGLNIVITPGAVGGAVDTVAVATVSLGVSGQPVPTDV